MRSGQVARIGRTEWADFSFPGDADLADVHFAVQCQLSGARVRKLANDRTLAVNAKEVNDAELQPGDTIQAGKTAFVVTFDGFASGASSTAAAVTVAGAAAGTALAASESPTKQPTASEIAEQLQMADEHQLLAAQVKSGPEFVALLAEHSAFAQAVRVQAHLLERRLAVWWGLLCVDDASNPPLPPPEAAAVKAARTWVEQPGESNRRHCEAVASKTKYDGPGSWLAMAAYWSGGSIAPPEMAEVPPDEKLTGQAVTSSLMIAAVLHDPTKAKARYRSYLAKALDVSSGKSPLPEK